MKSASRRERRVLETLEAVAPERAQKGKINAEGCSMPGNCFWLLRVADLIPRCCWRVGEVGGTRRVVLNITFTCLEKG